MRYINRRFTYLLTYLEVRRVGHHYILTRIKSLQKLSDYLVVVVLCWWPYRVR